MHCERNLQVCTASPGKFFNLLNSIKEGLPVARIKSRRPVNKGPVNNSRFVKASRNEPIKSLYSFLQEKTSDEVHNVHTKGSLCEENSTKEEQLS